MSLQYAIFLRPSQLCSLVQERVFQHLIQVITLAYTLTITLATKEFERSVICRTVRLSGFTEHCPKWISLVCADVPLHHRLNVYSEANILATLKQDVLSRLCDEFRHVLEALMRMRTGHYWQVSKMRGDMRENSRGRNIWRTWRNAD